MISNGFAADREARVYVAGHAGLVGSAIVRALRKQGYENLVLKNSKELDLRDQAAVREFYSEEKPDYVFMAAAKVGGIWANDNYPAEFIYDNLMIEANLIDGAYRAGIERLLFLGSTCIYPKLAEQPMREEALLTGVLEPTNEPYAVSKIAGIKLCESYNRQYGTRYRSVMPTNLYGEKDNFHPTESHVIPGLLRRFHEAREARADKVVVWGSGNARREFLHVDDMADACVFVMSLEDDTYDASTQPMLSHINIGTGVDVSIRELSEIIRQVVDYQGAIEFDSSKPDGAPRKVTDVSLINRLGWKHGIDLTRGLKVTYDWFVRHADDLRS